jgi:2-polyprenyl-3-methyl-5-hydroxy-6-metoxy-1,4-benzoquinol methylase
MEYVICNLCGADRPLPFATARDRQHWLPGVFTLVQCGRCGLIYLNPRPDAGELAGYYPDDYDLYAAPPGGRAARLAQLNLRYAMAKRCRLVERHAPGRGRVLDVGCATGLFLDAMRRRGWQAQGVELVEYAAAQARERRGLDVRTGDLAQARYPDAQFDAVTMWDVLEHVPDPLSELREIRRILKPGGVVVLRVPDVSSPEARWFGEYWIGLDAPRHLYVFSPTTLAALLARAGLEPLEQLDLAGNHHAWALSVQGWAGERWGPARGRQIRAALQSLPIRLLLAPYFSAVSATRQGTLLSVVARRPLAEHAGPG